MCLYRSAYWKKHTDQNYTQNPFILSIQERNYWVGSLLLSLLRKSLEISLTEIFFPSVSFKNVDEEFSFIGNITQLRYNINNYEKLSQLENFLAWITNTFLKCVISFPVYNTVKGESFFIFVLCMK